MTSSARCMKSFICRLLAAPKPRSVVSPLGLGQCCNAVSLEGKNATTEWNYGRNYCIGDREECTRGRAEAEHLFTAVRDDKQWAACAGAAGLWHPGCSVQTWNPEFILSKCTFEFANTEHNIWEKVDSTSLRLAGCEDGWRRGMQECPAERPMKSRAPVAPGRHKEVDLAAKPRVMCLHLNEKARKERETGKGRERNTG